MRENRQLNILLHLLKYNKTTHAQLADIFQVSIKTIQRDIDSLSSLGIPITCRKGHNGGIFIDEGYKLSRSTLNTEEFHHIALALYALDGLTSKSNRQGIMNKLTLLYPQLTKLFEQDVNDYFIIDLFDEDINMDEPIYHAINDCFETWSKIIIEIHSEELLIAPISYILKSDGLYLYAFCENYLLIDIKNISEYKKTEIPFERNFLPYNKNNFIVTI